MMLLLLRNELGRGNMVRAFVFAALRGVAYPVAQTSLLDKRAMRSAKHLSTVATAIGELELGIPLLRL
jgi:hypothetical protein